MTAQAALHQFFSGFGIPAYAATDLSARDYPYLTYDTPISHLDEGETAAVVQIWYKTESEAIPNAKAKELADAIGRGSKEIPCDEGIILIKRGSPWMQPLNDETDTSIKRRYINVSLEFLT